MEFKESVLGKLRDDVLRYQYRLCLPNVDDLRNRILKKAHGSLYLIYQGSTKMYHDLRILFWWDYMEKNIADYVEKFPNFQQIKAEYLKLSGLLQ